MKSLAEVIQLSLDAGHRFYVVILMMIHEGLNEDNTSISLPGACRWLTGTGRRQVGRGAGGTRKTCFSMPTNSLVSNPENKARRSCKGSEPCGIFRSLLTCSLSPVLFCNQLNVRSARKALFPFTGQLCQSPEQSTHTNRTSSLPRKSYHQPPPAIGASAG